MPITDRISNRRQDSVIPMLFEMNRSFLEDVYIGKMRERCALFVATIDAKLSIRDVVTFFECDILVQYMFERPDKTPRQSRIILINVMEANRNYDFFNLIHILYGRQNTDFGISVIEGDGIIEEFLSLGYLKPQNEHMAVFILGSTVGLKRLDLETVSGGSRDMTNVPPGEIDRFFDWLQNTDFAKNFASFLVRGKELLDQIGIEREEKRDEVMSLLIPSSRE